MCYAEVTYGDLQYMRFDVNVSLAEKVLIRLALERKSISTASVVLNVPSNTKSSAKLKLLIMVKK